MSEPAPPPNPDVDRFARRIGELRASLSGADPLRLASHTGAKYYPLQPDQGEFLLPYWEQSLRLSYPAFEACHSPSEMAVSPFTLAMLLYYFTTADGAPLSGQWISFAELPSGRFYAQAFQGYTGQELARFFQADQARFERAAHSLGGQRQPLGDAAFSWHPLPRVPLLAIFWQGDEDFPASFQVLFDASASHYLPTDAYAILGSNLTHKLIAASPT